MILRVKCQVCGTTFSLHPDFLVRQHQYSREMISSWLLAWMRGSSFRSESYLSVHAVSCPAPDPDLSWSDLLDVGGSELRPRYQLLHRWSSCFTVRAARVLPFLVVACIARGHDVRRTVAPWLEHAFPGVPRRAACLALTLSFWAVLTRRTEQPVDAGYALRTLLGILPARPLPASHNARRASQGAVRYDLLTHAGRDPTVQREGEIERGTRDRG